ncbi:MAG: hypothetical protein SXQ77_11325, partial [Halobacteria archaeon]|nr:hypothetical protein [Halobacteria archaeon]
MGASYRHVLVLLVFLTLVVPAVPVSADTGVGSSDVYYAQDGSDGVFNGNTSFDGLPNRDTVLAKGSPEFQIITTDNNVKIGSSKRIVFNLLNVGNVKQGGIPSLEKRVTTAKDVRIEVNGGSMLSIEPKRIEGGIAPAGQKVPIPLEVTVDENAHAGTYEVSFNIEYSYARTAKLEQGSVVYGEAEGSQTVEAEIQVTDQARFRIVDVTSNVSVGGTGTLELDIKNVGSTGVKDSTVELHTSSGTATFGSSVPSASAASSGGMSMSNLPSGVSLSDLQSMGGIPSQSGSSSGSGLSVSGNPESFTGKWKPGVTKTVRYQVKLPDDAIVRNYTVKAQVVYSSGDGREK